MVLLFVLVLWQQPGEHIPARPHRHKVAEHSGGEAPPKFTQNIKGPPKRDWRVCKGTCKENYGEPPKRQTPVRGYWLGPTNVFLRGNEKWWKMMKNDETWWNMMKHDEIITFHHVSSCFIMFHHVSSFCIQAQFGWEIFYFHPEGVWLMAFGQPFWLQI